MTGRKHIALISAAVLAAILLWTAGLAPADAAAPKGRLSANQFVSLKPFIIPMTPKDGERRQFTLMVALELVDEEDRDFVKGRVPLIRSKVYDLLFRLIAYRTQEPLVPSIGLIKRKMLDIAGGITGPDRINSIVVQQVYTGRAP